MLAASRFRVQSSGFRVLVLVPVLVSVLGLVPVLGSNENPNQNQNSNQNRNSNKNQNPEPRTLNPEPRSLRVGVLRPGGGYAVTEIPLEAYVARVLAGEAARDSQPAAL